MYKGILITAIVSIILVLTFFSNEVSAKSNNVSLGGVEANWDKISPENITISTGDSVTWTNPSVVAEPHTVTIMTDNKLFPPLASVFSIPNNVVTHPVGPPANVEPIILPDTTNSSNKLIVMDNARAYNPVILDSSSSNATYLQPNANYTIAGNESYINSGFIWPEGQSPPGAAPINSFTLVFNKPGSYDYFCALHPWMTGSVKVS